MFRSIDADDLLAAMWSVRLNLIQFTTDRSQWVQFQNQASNIMASAYRSYDVDHQARPDQAKVEDILRKAFAAEMEPLMLAAAGKLQAYLG